MAWSLPAQTCFSIHIHWNQATVPYQIGFLLMAWIWLIPGSSEQLVSPFCMAGPSYLVVLRSHVAQLGRSSLPRSHLPHHSVAFSWFNLSTAFITNGTQLSFFFFSNFAYLDIICLLCWNISSKRAGICLSLLSPQPGLVTITMAGAQ